MSESKISNIFIKLNPVIKPLLDSRFHRLLSRRLMLIRFTGRKSGKQFITPVAYKQFGDTVLIGLAETHNRVWWRNYRDVWPMEVKLRGQWQSGFAKYLNETDKDYVEQWQTLLESESWMPKIFHTDYEAKTGITAEQKAFLLQYCGLVKFSPKENAFE